MQVPPAAPAKVVVRGLNVELTDFLRNAAAHRAERLLEYDPSIRLLQLTVEHTPRTVDDLAFTAKGEVDFGGPALFTSVTARDAMEALDYLIQKLEHQLRRARAPRRSEPRPMTAPVGVPAAAGQ